MDNVDGVVVAITLIHPLSDQRASPRRLIATAGQRTSRRLTVTVAGEVDASNAKDFAVTVCEAAMTAENVELDLTGLEFIAVDGIAALHAINAHLARKGASWLLLPSRAVLRVLDLCDPEHLIPRAGMNQSTSSAIA